MLGIGNVWGAEETISFCNATSSYLPTPLEGSVSVKKTGQAATNGYKLGSSGDYVQWTLTTSTISSASFSGWVNSNNTTYTLGYAFSSDNGATWGTTETLANTGTKACDDYDIPSSKIPTGANAIRVIRTAGTSTYACSITLTYSSGDDPDPTCETPTISWDKTPQGGKVGDADFTASVATNQTDASVTWTSSKTSVATVSNGKIHYVAEGTTTITAKYTGSGDYCDDEVEVTKEITVTGGDTPTGDCPESGERFKAEVLKACTCSVASKTEHSVDPQDISVDNGSVGLYCIGSSTKAIIIKTTNSELQLSLNTGDVAIHVVLDCALAAGDVISWTGNNGSNDYQLYITPTNAAKPSSSSLKTTSYKYTVTAEDSLVGKEEFYLWRVSSTTNIKTISVTRPATETYTLSFNANGGSGTVADITGSGNKTLPAANAFTAPSGKEFKEWNTKDDGTGTGYAAGATYNLSANATLYAIWQTKVTKYNVTFAAGEGSGTMDALQYAANAEVTLPTCTFTAPTGKEFDKWTSTDVTISDGKFTMPANDVTVTATWKVKSYSVSKNPINCSFEVPQSVEHGGSFEVTVTPNTGYNLPDDVTVINATKDWNKSTGVLQVTNVTGQPQVTVECVAKTTTVTLDANTANHGSGSNSSVTATYGAVLPSFTHCTPADDYVLDGYYTTATGGDKIINADRSLVANTVYADGDKKWKYTESAVTLYAQYVDIPTELSGLESGVLYKPGDMLPYGNTISSSSLYVAGLSANGKFFIVGKASSGTDGAPEIKTGNEVTYGDCKSNNYLYFKDTPPTITNNIPTSRAIKFILSNAGILKLYGKSNQVLFKEGASSTISVTYTDNVWTSSKLEAGTYYLYANGTSRNIVGLKFTKSASSDATLKSITINGSAIPGFVSGTTSYNATLEAPVGNVTIVGTPTDENAKSVVVTPPSDDKKAGTYTITVTAEDGTTTKTYTVNVTINVTITTAVNNSDYGSVSASLSKIAAGTSVSVSEDGYTFTIGEKTITATPTESDAQYTYALDSWTWSPELVNNQIGESNVTVTANFSRTINKYTITAVVSLEGYGTLDKNQLTNVPYGTSISANGATLTIGEQTITATAKEQDDQYTYAFSEWTGIPAGGQVIEATTVTASFTREARTYNISYVLGDGASWVDDYTAPEEYTYGEGKTLPTEDKLVLPDGATFFGWYDNAEFTGDPVTAIGTDATGDKTFYASWTTAATYTITYNMNGHGIAVDPTTVIDGDTWTAPEDPTATGYTFDGWKRAADTGDETLYKNGDTGFTPQSDETLTAQWTEIKVESITADPSSLDLKKDESKEVTLTISPDNALNKDITIDDASTTETVLKSGTTYTYIVTGTENGEEKDLKFENTNSDKQVTVKVKVYCLVEYETNGADAIESVKYYSSSDEITLPTPTPAPAGYSFGGWYLKSDFSGTQYNAGTKFNPSDNCKLYAKWTAKTIQITFDANGGKIDGEDTKVMEYTYDGAALTLPTPTSALTFDGWYDAATGGNKIENVGGSNKPTENTRYYAHWQKATPTITWNTIPTKVYKGGQYEIKVTTNSDYADVTALTAENGTLVNKAVNNGVYTAMLQIATDATSAPTVTLNLLATDNYAAKSETKSNITLGSCEKDEEQTIIKIALAGTKGTDFKVTGSLAGTGAVKGLSSDSPYKLNTDGAYVMMQLKDGEYFEAGDIFHVKMEFNQSTFWACSDNGTTELVSKTVTKASGVVEETMTLPSNMDEINSIWICRNNTFNQNGKVESMWVTRTIQVPDLKTPSLVWDDEKTDEIEVTYAPDAATHTYNLSAVAGSAGTLAYSVKTDENILIASYTDGVIALNPVAGSAVVQVTVPAHGCFIEKTIERTITQTLPDIATPTVSIANTDQEPTLSVCAGNEGNFSSITATPYCDVDGASFTYAWYKGDAVIENANEATYTPNKEGTYTCKVTASKEGYAPATSDAPTGIEYTVVPLPAATFVETTQTILLGGSDYNFIVSEISNAEKYTLTWSPVVANGPAAVTEPTTRGEMTTFTGSIGSVPGNYTGTLTFFNSLGCPTEYNLMLNVTIEMTTPAVVTPEPICADGESVLTFQCSNELGENEIFYWQETADGVSTEHPSTIKSPATAGTYTYYVRCYNTEAKIFGEAVACTGTIQPTLVPSTLEEDNFYLVGATATALDATAEGGIETKSYQWQSTTTPDDEDSWTDITTGGDGATYTPSTEEHDTTYYRCQVTSGACEATTNVAEVEVCGHYPVVTTPTTAQTFTAIEDEAVTLHVTAAPHTDVDVDAWGLHYQWYKGETSVPNANDADYTIEQVKTTDAGIYYCKVTEDNGCYTVTSPAFTLSVTSTEPTCDWKEIISAVWTGTNSATIGGTIGGEAHSDGLSGSGPYKIDKDGLPNGAGVTLATGTFKKGDKVTVHWKQADMTTTFQLFADANGTTELVNETLTSGTEYTATYELPKDAAGIYLVRTSSNNQNHQIYSISVSRYMCDEGLMTFMDYTGDGKWSTAANWAGTTTPATSLPTIGTITKIMKDVTISANAAQAARVDLCDNSTLTIAPTGGLNVAGKVQHEGGAATTIEDITIQSTAEGNGALIFNNNDGQSAATVQLYSKAYSEKNADGKTLKYWQYIGMPTFVGDVLDIFEGASLYRYHEESGWEKIKAYNPAYSWYGYGVSYSKEQDKQATYTFAGSLVETATKEINLTNTDEVGEGANMVANSWTAPINIKQFDLSDFAGAEATVYIFNTGRDREEYGGEATIVQDLGNETPGQWSTYPINAVKQSGWKGETTIPSMQAFQVNVAEGEESATLTLDYDRLVRPATNQIGNNVMHSPARNAAVEAEPEMMWMRVADADTRADIYLLQRNDFSTNWDNGWDGSCFDGDGRSPMFYSVSDELGKMTVQATDDWEGMPIGFAPAKPAVHTISFDYNGMSMWWLNDIKTQTSTLIDAENTYSFTSEEGDDEARFYISATPLQRELPTGFFNLETAKQVKKIIYNEHLYIILDGLMFDGQGKHVK